MSDKYDEYFGFARIGEGALGGKGRGLAFIDSFLTNTLVVYFFIYFSFLLIISS